MLQSHNPSGGPSGGRRPAPIDRPIVLVGLMGVGKSTVGKRLATRLKLPFVDADHEIERAAGHSIVEIFARFGEAAFRDGERRVIARLIDSAILLGRDDESAALAARFKAAFPDDYARWLRVRPPAS